MRTVLDFSRSFTFDKTLANRVVSLRTAFGDTRGRNQNQYFGNHQSSSRLIMPSNPVNVYWRLELVFAVI